MNYKNLIMLATKETLTWEDWLSLTKRLERRIYFMLGKFSLKPLGELIAINDYHKFKLCEIGTTLCINSEGVDLKTQGIFGTLYFDGVIDDRSESRTRYKFGYTRDGHWLLISITYHESPENTQYASYLDEVTVSKATLEDLLCITPYPDIIWKKLKEVVDEWYQNSKDRKKEVGKIRKDFQFIEKLMSRA